ncbi:MAG: hypothetical protein LBJ00_11185 [Planctomycetaceae bacterium]|jgi:hypothetical protein|nr:hypothetical protein [Planctomycetaceae bacterium]
MPTSMLQYEMLPTTWFYVSTLIILAVFFKFNRVWSVRNLDLVGIILITPGLIWLAMSDDLWGYIWLFVLYFLLLIRLFFDTVMVRRPLLEPNLTPGSLTFSCFFLVLFVVAALTVNRGNKIDTVRTVRLEHILTTRHLDQKIGMNPATLNIPPKELPNLQPGFRPFLVFAERTSLAFTPPPKIRAEILQNRSAVPNLGLATFSESVLVNTITNPETTALPANASVLQIPIASDPPTSTRPNTAINSAVQTTANSTPLKTIPTPVMLSESEPNIDSAIAASTSEISKTSSDVVVPNLPPKLEMFSEQTESPNNSNSPATHIIPTPTLKQFSLIMLVSLSAHFLIVLAFIYIGHCHFGNIHTGVACAALYLLLPYTNQMVGRLDHVVPAVLILWGVAVYRSPFYSGFCIGSAAALVFYPIFLVPLWCSFYWRRGWVRFLVGAIAAIVSFAILLCFSPSVLGTYNDQLIHMFGKSSLLIFSRADGFWNYTEVIYRVPVIACFFAICFGMLLWPQHKHLATLLSCSTIVMLGTQFWQPHQGGLCIAWFVPLLILTIFRPNLEDRVAQATVS